MYKHVKTIVQQIEMRVVMNILRIRQGVDKIIVHQWDNGVSFTHLRSKAHKTLITLNIY